MITRKSATTVPIPNPSRAVSRTNPPVAGSKPVATAKVATKGPTRLASARSLSTLSLASRGVSPAKANRTPGATFPKGSINPSAWQDAAVEIVAAGRGRINYSVGVIKAIGLGAIAPPTLRKSRSQDLLDARDAAFADALRSLSLAVAQVRVTADTRVSNYVLKSDEVRTRIEGMVRNATVIEEKLLPKSGVYRLVVQAQLTGPNSLMEAIDPETAKSGATVAAGTPAEKPNPFQPGAPAPADAEFTSLIVDCRGLGVTACMSPRIFDTDHQEIYGTMKVSPEYVIETGIASFPRSIQDAYRCARAGAKPLIVRAVGVADNNRFYPIIRKRDADRVFEADRTSHFFERTAVILLLDP